MTTAVIYARYSSSGQREESIEGQIRECTEYATRKGYKILRAYTDKALTGTSDRRPGFQQMIKDSEKQAFDCVICWKTDRFARNRYDAAIYKARLKKNGVRLEYARESVPEGPEGVILESVLEGMAEFFSKSLSENVKRGLMDSALKHKARGRRIYGYDIGPDDLYVINEAEAAAVRLMFEMYDAGKTQKEIMQHLTRIGAPAPRGRSFSRPWVSRNLRCDAYIGTYRYKDLVDEDVIPAIVEKDLFKRVQKRLEAAPNRRRQRPGTNSPPVTFLLTGKAFCGLCGDPMTGDSARGKNGEKRYYYTCKKKKTRCCEKRREPKEPLETFVINALIDLLHTPSYIESWAEECVKNLSADNSVMDALKARRSEIQRRIDNVSAALELQDVPSRTLTKRLTDLEAELDQVEDDIRTEQLNAPIPVTKDQIIFFLSELARTEPNDSLYRMRLVDYFLNAVYVYEDKIILHLNLSSGNSQVTYERNNEVSDKRAESTPSVILSEAMIVSVVLTRPAPRGVFSPYSA